MYFKKLELVGFKSFLEKTSLHFEPGITAVVGPNGTGKSNIFDSIRWVLGEQSVKAMRGSQMQDVIFNGSDSKEPLGMAEVTLIFDNSNRFFNLDHNEVAITRRVFRSGESEYMLNKSFVRLKDIVDLFMGTGIGAQSYSLVAQGKIDLILSLRPEDRRLVFDEASGITKYKTQKKEAIRKLDETEQNLTRVNDIIAEVKRQIDSLARQANKAHRYKEVFEELKSKEINLAILQKRRFLSYNDTIIKELTGLENQETVVLNRIKNQEAQTVHSQAELKIVEAHIIGLKNEILNLDNSVIINREHINFNQERMLELETTKKYLQTQIGQVKTKLLLDEEKLKYLTEEYNNINKNIKEKSVMLEEKEGKLNTLASSIKLALEDIREAKKELLELAAKIANINNEIMDITAKQQIYSARKKRMEIEMIKLKEEITICENNLKSINRQLQDINIIIKDLNSKSSKLKDELAQEDLFLKRINLDIEQLERQVITLQSHKEFIEKLKTKYEDIEESMNALVYLDKLPNEKLTGLLVKIKSFKERDTVKDSDLKAQVFLKGEAKPFDLDTERINQRLGKIEQDISSLKNIKKVKEKHIEELNKLIQELQQELRSQEIILSNKKASHINALEQCNKIKEEEDIINLELSDMQKEISILQDKLTEFKNFHSQLDKRHKELEDIIMSNQNNIDIWSDSREKILVMITQTKTELEALVKRTDSDKVTIKLLEDTYHQDKDSLLNIERQIQELENKRGSLILEIEDFENKINQNEQYLETQKELLKDKEDGYQKILSDITDISKRIELDRRELDGVKNRSYEVQLKSKDVDFKFLNLKDRILQSYKMDLETVEDLVVQENNEDVLTEKIEKLKVKLDSYGTVNLVAIEEYDELNKRYDFLIQQQNDLIKAKESLNEAILKINRFTKKMFLETFERIREEFRNYFRLLFNGGDAQLFLMDEHDILESGIEIVCRPPGKKLQNVLLLSGGEKALSAIALIFAIFKVKPSPFCILDEIDAALDEANVDRFSRLLQEFTKYSQFIVITHNKRTIANADVMYGITMEESGVSRVVSVKFASDKLVRDKEAKTSLDAVPV